MSLVTQCPHWAAAPGLRHSAPATVGHIIIITQLVTSDSHLADLDLVPAEVSPGVLAPEGDPLVT